MENACVHNNCLDRLTGNYHMLTEDQANDFNELDDQQADEEASNKTSPGNGLTPFPTPSKGKPLSEDQRERRESFLTRDDDDEEKVKARQKQTAGTSSTVFATAAVKRAESSTRIFVNKKTLQCDTHQERNFHMELWLFLTEGLPKTLMRDIIIGDINAIYMRIMALGQTNAVATRRYLHNQLNNIQKDDHSWPNYLHRFHELCDSLAAIGSVNKEEDLLGCLINGLQTDLRYTEVIRKIECARNPYSLQKAIDVITANAVNTKDNDLFQDNCITVNTAEADDTNSRHERRRIVKSTATCRKHLNGKPCHTTPCPYAHSKKNSSGTSQTIGASPNPQELPHKSKLPCNSLIQNKACEHGQKCHFSHDSALVEEARQVYFASNLETEDYSTEAMCIEEADEADSTQQLPNSLVHKTPRNFKEKFRNAQGSPRDYVRSWDFAAIRACSVDIPVQDGQSKLDHLDVPDAQEIFRHVKSTRSKVARQPTSPPDSSFPIVRGSSYSAMGLVAVRDASQVAQASALSAQITVSPNYLNCQLPASVFDTGASAHCFPLNEYFLQAAVPGSLVDCNVIIKTAKKGENMTATKKADFLLKSTAKPKGPNDTPTILLRQALLSPSFRRGLISATALTADGLSLQFEGNKCTLFNEAGEICMQVSRSDFSLYEVPHDLFVSQHLLELNLTLAEANLARSYSVQSTRIWHERLGHNSATRLAGLYAEKGLKLISNHDDCIDCTQAKIHRANYPKTSNFRAEFAGQSFSVDYVGPFRVQSPFGHRFLCVFLDVKSRFTTTYPAKLKSELPTLVDEYIAMTERVQQPNKVVTIVSDGALCQKEHLASLRERGITVIIVAPDSSRLNMVERRNRIIEESGRAMNMSAGLPPTLFILACEYATTIQNFLPLKSITFGKTQSNALPLSETRNPCSQELWTRRNLGSWSDLVKNFRVYGCLAFILHRHPNKQVNKSERAIFLGLARNNHNAFVMMSLETKNFSRFITSRDVICHENILPFKKAMDLPKNLNFKHAEEHGQLEEESPLEIGLPNSSSSSSGIITHPDNIVDTQADASLDPRMEADLPVSALQPSAPLPTPSQTAEAELTNN